MKLSEYTMEYLGNVIAGDVEGFPYRSGPQLVRFFNQFGARDVYPAGGGFPTRRIYAQDKLKELNGAAILREVIAKALDPREFARAEKPIDDAVASVNENLKYDVYEVVRDGLMFKVRDLGAGKIRLDAAAHIPDELTQLAIDENIRKCETKLSEGDFSGAITNARSMIEAVLIGIERELRYDTGRIRRRSCTTLQESSEGAEPWSRAKGYIGCPASDSERSDERRERLGFDAKQDERCPRGYVSARSTPCQTGCVRGDNVGRLFIRDQELSARRGALGKTRGIDGVAKR